MSIEKNVQVVKDFFAAIGSGDKQHVLALVAEDIEWIVPGEDWPLAGTHRGHAGLAKARGVAADQIHPLIAEATDRPALGFIGEPRVNVLMLNVALDQKFPSRK